MINLTSAIIEDQNHDANDAHADRYVEQSRTRTKRVDLRASIEALEGIGRESRGKKTKGSRAHRARHDDSLDAAYDRLLNRIVSPEAPEGVAQAPAPPVMTPELWASMCDRGDIPQCRDRGFKGELCWACEWAKACELYLRVSPWKKELHVEVVRVHRWSNVYGAIRTYAEHVLHGQSPPSALGPILDNIETGAIRIRSGGTSHGSASKEDRIMVSGDDMVPIVRALSAAFDANRWGIPYWECVAVLIVRDGGVATGPGGKQPTWEQIGEVCRLPPKMLRDIAARGRHCLTVELCARAMLPMPARHVGMHGEIAARREQFNQTEGRAA